MNVQRLPLSAAYVDPAFVACLREAIGVRELVKNFDRLHGATLGTKHTKDDMRAFTAFVHDGIYLRLADEALDSLRARAVSEA